jgi:hypothetical protein
VDGGSENFNEYVDELVITGKLTITEARIDVKFSNSVIEANFRSIKYNHLYNHHLYNIDTVRKHTDFYYPEQNSEMPHSAFNGATPEEMYYGRWTAEDGNALRCKTKSASEKRRVFHLSLRCPSCFVT